MIKVFDDKLVSDYEFVEVDGTILNVNASKNEIIEVQFYNQKPLKIEVNIIKEGNAKILFNNSNDLDIKMNVGRNAHLLIDSLLAKKTNYEFTLLEDSSVTFNEVLLAETSNRLNINLVEENANAMVKCLAIGANCNINLKQAIDHKAKSTLSTINNYGCALTGANINFDTTGHIQNGMAKSDCRQLSKGIVIGDDASVLSKPILLIDEFDVKAYHGAAIGKMSDEDLFYLMSRGLTKTEAFKLMLQGIIDPIIDGIFVEEIKENVRLMINKMI